MNAVNAESVNIYFFSSEASQRGGDLTKYSRSRDAVPDPGLPGGLAALAQLHDPPFERPL